MRQQDQSYIINASLNSYNKISIGESAVCDRSVAFPMGMLDYSVSWFHVRHE